MQVRIDFTSVEQAIVVMEALKNTAASYRSQAEMIHTTPEEDANLSHKARLIEEALRDAVKQ